MEAAAAGPIAVATLEAPTAVHNGLGDVKEKKAAEEAKGISEDPTKEEVAKIEEVISLHPIKWNHETGELLSKAEKAFAAGCNILLICNMSYHQFLHHDQMLLPDILQLNHFLSH